MILKFQIYENRRAYLMSSTLVAEYIWTVLLVKYTEFVCIGGLLNVFFIVIIT